MGTGCGCGCDGGTGTGPSVFVRPRFFAGQLLTEDDLGLLVDYLTAKNRLYHRSLHGPGVIRGLDVSCDPCGGGTVVVTPGHALDCAGQDIVVACAERVDVRALVRERRIAALGVDCGDPCEEEGARRYGLYVRYEEQPVEPVAPYATEEPCPSPGCVPSRIREGYRFVVGCDAADDHRHNPGTRLLEILGDRARADGARDQDRRLVRYLDALFAAVLAPGRPFRFDGADAQRHRDALAWLRERTTGGTPPPDLARELTERVRALAASVARFDTYDRVGQEQLVRDHPDLGSVGEARSVLAAVCDRLTGTATDAVWPNPLRRSLARAVVTESRARLVSGQGERTAPLEVRMLAQGTPLDHALRVEFRGDLTLIREWLLGRLERTARVTDCALRPDVLAVEVPLPLPPPPAGSTEPATLTELRLLAEAAAGLTGAVRRFVTGAACATLSPPCDDCSDTDVLLADVRLDGCDVVEICAAGREQVLPGGAAYGEWLSKLPRLRELAGRLCCVPAGPYRPPEIPSQEPVPRPYAEGLLAPWPRTGELEEMLALLLTPGPGETPPKALRGQFGAPPGEAVSELDALGARVGELTGALGLVRDELGEARRRLGEAREELDRVREDLPQRLGSRLEALEKAPKGQGPAGTPAQRTRTPRAAEQAAARTTAAKKTTAKKAVTKKTVAKKAVAKKAASRQPAAPRSATGQAGGTTRAARTGQGAQGSPAAPEQGETP
ncbi:hypothetical protein [Streptomyces yaizuensis]|uniref:LigA protein n=1 Tax=Streptomyces yaizuensis TaxID=2989713 RepID=A0ABQ5NSL9_9ACTN|nr:hypothetical protein [Streptomyces sp. YSPA8]GLF93373.1 hypothetical protein SYYSPA8_03770 [Streptomyces sp. YSPA8]